MYTYLRNPLAIFKGFMQGTDPKCRKLGLKDEDSVLAALGSVQFTGFDLVNSLYPELINTKSAPLSSEQDSINFIGLSPDSNGSPAPCCLPIPGDPIVGIAQKKTGVVVHAIDCALLASFEAKPSLWLEVRWPLGTNKPVHSTSIEVIMVNSVGVLGRICTLIGEQGANISDLTFVMRKPDFYKTVFEITVRDLKHLHNIITSIQEGGNLGLGHSQTVEIQGDGNIFNLVQSGSEYQTLELTHYGHDTTFTIIQSDGTYSAGLEGLGTISNFDGSYTQPVPTPDFVQGYLQVNP